MNTALKAALVSMALGATAPALADVKAGVDAWQQGDYGRAVTEWRPLAAAGDADAQFNLGQAYKLGRGVPVDLPIAMQWFRKAADQGHLRAADNYGLLLFQQGKREDAMPFIRKSADRGEPRAQYILGTAMFNGDLAPKDWVMAYALMTRAAAAGLDQASTSLASMDKWIPTEQRQKGLSLAAQMAKPRTMTASAEPTATLPPRPQPVVTPPAPPVKAPPVKREPPRPIATTSLPPSNAGTPVPPVANTPAPRPVRPVVAAAPPAAPVSPPEAPPAAPRAKLKPPVPSVATSASGSWRVQLGAFRDEANAKALWNTVSARLGGSYQPYLVRGGDVTRLQAGPLRSEADAERLCGKIRSGGQACLVKHN